MANKTRQYEGDFRLWILDPTNGTKTPVNPDATDPYGNTPVEASAAVPSYEAGDERTITSKRRDRYGLIIHRDEDPGVNNFQLTLVQAPALIVARMFQGAATVTSVAAGAVTDEVVTIVTLGVPAKLSRRLIKTSPAPVVTNSAGTTTYVVGDDYTINSRTGEITAVTGGDIVAGPIKVDFSNDAYERVSIRGGAKPVEHFYITGDLMNRPDKSDLMMEIFDVTLSVSGDVDLLSSEPINIELSGTMITPSDKTEPYTVDQFTATA